MIKDYYMIRLPGSPLVFIGVSSLYSKIILVFFMPQKMKDYFTKEPVTLPKKKEGKRKAKSCDPQVATRANKPVFLEENGTMQN